MKGKTLLISSAFDRKKITIRLQWTIYPSGWVKMQVNYFPADLFYLYGWGKFFFS